MNWKGWGLVFCCFSCSLRQSFKAGDGIAIQEEIDGRGTTPRRESATVSLWSEGGGVGDAGKTASKLK